MKVVLVTNAFAPTRGGVQTHVNALADALVSIGDTVEVCTQTADRTLPAVDELPNGVLVHRFLLPVHTEHYGLAPRLVSHLHARQQSYDIVHAHNYHGLPALAAAWTSRPFVFTPFFHGTSASRFRSLLHVPYRRVGHVIFRRAASVICVSAAEAKLVASTFPEIESVITTIPSGVPTRTDAQPYPVAGRVVLSIGRLVDYKRAGNVIGALRQLDERHFLVIVGDGPERERLEHYAAQAGLTSRVRFTGNVSDAERARWYATASAVVTSSLHESFGLTVAEGAVAGAQVVASDIPVHSEMAAMVGRGVKLVPPEASAAELAAAIEAACDEGRLASPLSMPTWGEIADRTHAVYAGVS